MSSERKYLIDQHAKTPSHIGKCEKLKRSACVQQSIRQCVASTSRNSEQEEYNTDLCNALISSNIPLARLNNVNLKSFLQKYCKYNIPDESTLRKNYVTSCYQQIMAEIQQLVGNNFVYIMVDESTDKCGRYIAHLLIGILHEDIVGKSYLIYCKELQKTNNVTIAQFVQEGLSNFFLPGSIPCEKILLMLSDAAPYMIKAAQNLKIFYSNIIHTTCLAHGFNRVAEDIRNQFPLINDLISNVKKVFLKAPLRIQFYKERLPGVKLPPEPIITRWGTWLEAAIFYADNFEGIKNVILEITADCIALEKCKKIVTSTELLQNLLYIKSNYSFVSSSIRKLETQGMSLSESVEIVDEFDMLCKKVKGTIGNSIYDKFNKVINKNAGYLKLKKVRKILEGETVNDFDFNISLECIAKLKNAPITSVDVERSFSISKHMYSDRRHNFLLHNFEKHLIINCFRNTL